MSITNMYGKYGAKLVECDNCGDGFETEDWADAQEAMKAEGWIQPVINGKRHHFCPNCKEAMK